MWSILVGAIAGILSLSALAVSLAALRAPQKANGDILRGFKQLEHDFEELEERVNSHLGRISRLKREMMSGREGTAGPDKTSPTLATSTSPVPAGPMTRSRLLAYARSKQKGGGGDAEVEDSIGADGR